MPDCCLVGVRSQGQGCCSDKALRENVFWVVVQMFARELAAGWTSWGNEVLKFQTLDNFVARAPGTSAAVLRAEPQTLDNLVNMHDL